jgi:hypothetical protein
LKFNWDFDFGGLAECPALRKIEGLLTQGGRRRNTAFPRGRRRNAAQGAIGKNGPTGKDKIRIAAYDRQPPTQRHGLSAMTATPLDRFAPEIRRFDQCLRPIAKGPGIDITTPGWSKRLRQYPQEAWVPPLDRAGIRVEAERLLVELVEAYAEGTEAGRKEIRELFRTYDSFRWAAALPHEPMTGERLRQQLVLFSIKDQESDARDAILWLDRLCAEAAAAHLALVPLLEEVAVMSSTENRFPPLRYGSTRDMLESRIRRIQAKP